MAQFNVQVLFLLILIIVSSECRDIQTGSAHEAVALFRVNSDEIDGESSYRVRVTKYTTDNEPMVIFEWPKKTRQDERMSWETDGNGLMSFHLKNLQRSDEGTYSCEIWRGWDRVLIRNTTLKVKECKILPGVKVKPDSSVRLKCSEDITSEERRPQNVSWAIMKGFNHHVSVHSPRVEIDDTSLIIQTVSHSDSGWYRCGYVLGQTKFCFEVRLNVQGAEDTPEFTTAPNTPTQASNTPTQASNTPTQTLQGSNQEAESRVTLITVVVSVSSGLMAAALLGLFYHCRQQRRKVTRHLAGTPTVTVDNYEFLIRSDSQKRMAEYESLNIPNQSSCTPTDQ